MAQFQVGDRVKIKKIRGGKRSPNPDLLRLVGMYGTVKAVIKWDPEESFSVGDFLPGLKWETEFWGDELEKSDRLIDILA